MKSIIYVAIGGALGSVLRYLATLYINQKTSYTFPIATFCINILGSLLIGIFASYFLKNSLENEKLLLITGLCGGFTTFSTFSFETLNLIQNGETLQAIIYVLSSVILGVLFTFIGFHLGIK